MLKIRGLWRQTDESGSEVATADKSTASAIPSNVPKPALGKKTDEVQTKLTVKKDDKILKTFNPVTPGQAGVTR